MASHKPLISYTTTIMHISLHDGVILEETLRVPSFPQIVRFKFEENEGEKTNMNFFFKTEKKDKYIYKITPRYKTYPGNMHIQ